MREGGTIGAVLSMEQILKVPIVVHGPLAARPRLPRPQRELRLGPGRRRHRRVREATSRRWPRYSSAVLTGRAPLSIGLALVTVAGINAAGLWSIAGARRAVAGEASRLFRADTEAAARALDGVPRGDARRSPVPRPAAAGYRVLLASDEQDPARHLRASAEAALLVFLRTHPEVTRLAIAAATASRSCSWAAAAASRSCGWPPTRRARRAPRSPPTGRGHRGRAHPAKTGRGARRRAHAGGRDRAGAAAHRTRRAGPPPDPCLLRDGCGPHAGAGPPLAGPTRSRRTRPFRRGLDVARALAPALRAAAGASPWPWSSRWRPAIARRWP